MDSGLRRTRNSQRSNIPFKKGMPSHKSMSEGEEIMAMSYNKPLTFYRKQNGKVWEIPFIDSTKNGYLQSKNINPIDLARSPSSNDVLQTDAFGKLKWISLSEAGDIHLSAISFSSSTGLFTSTLTNSIAKTVNLDGRYLLISGTHNHSTSEITSGTMADSRIASSNITQHEASIDHDALTNFLANEHIDWTTDQGSTNIHSGNYTDTNTTYVSSDFDHDLLTNFLANEHIDWTADQGSTNIHAGNYTDTNTTDHTAFENIGTNTHAQLDTHLALTNEHIDWTADQGSTNIHSGNYPHDHDSSYHPLGGGSTSDLSVRNLTIYGEVDEYSSVIVTIDDAFIKLNTGNSEVDAGLIVETGDTDDARLFYDVSANDWLMGENQVYETILGSSNYTSYIDHDSLTNFVANEHIDWTNASQNLSTSGTITASGYDDTNWDTAYTHSQVAGGNSVHVSTTENTNWDTAYTYSQVGHLPLSGDSTLTGWLDINEGAVRTTRRVLQINEGINANLGHVSYDTVLIQSDDAPTIRLRDSGVTNGSGTICQDNDYMRIATNNNITFATGLTVSEMGYSGGTTVLTLDSSQNATFAGDILFDDSTNSIGNTTNRVHHIHMRQGGTISFGDYSSGNPIGITEGTWDSYGTDSDKMAIYYRSSLKFYGYPDGDTLALTLGTSGVATFAGSVTIKAGETGTGANAGGQLLVQSTVSGQTASMLFSDGVNSNGWFGYDNSATAANRSFWWSTTDGVSKQMVLKENGNVGINDTTPTYKLDVNGTFRTTGAATFDTTATFTGNLSVTDASSYFKKAHGDTWVADFHCRSADYQGVRIRHDSSNGSGGPGSSGNSALLIDDQRSNNMTSANPTVKIMRSGANTNGEIFRVETHGTSRFYIADSGAATFTGKVNIYGGNTTATLGIKCHDNSWDGGIRITDSANATYARIHQDTVSDYGLMIGDTKLYIAQGVGINTTAGSYLLNVNGTSNFSGNATFAGTVLGANGSNSAPEYSFSGDTDTGMYQNGANNLAFTTGGTSRLNFSSDGSATFTGTVNFVGGTNSGLLYHGETSGRILADGVNKNFGSESFTSGTSGWRIDGSGDAEFHNIVARGEFHTAVFVKDEIHATGGTNLIANAGTLKADFTSATSPTTFTFDIKDPVSGHASIFSVNDIVRIKALYGAGSLDNWIKVTVVTDNTSYYTYTGVLQSGTAGTFSTGTAVIQYGNTTSGGGMMLTSDLSYSPYLEIFTHSGSPWTSTVTKLRIGNLAGITDSDLGGALSGYGLYSENVYLKGNITLASGTFKTNISGARIEIDGSNNTLNFYDPSDNNIITIDDGVFGSSPGIKFGTNAYIYFASSGGTIHFRDGNDNLRITGQLIEIKSQNEDKVIYIDNEPLGTTASSSNSHYGLYTDIVNQGSGDAYGIYATSSSTSGTAWAGYFDDGNVKIVNDLIVGGRINGAELGNQNITRTNLSLYLDFNDKSCHSGTSSTEVPVDLGPNNYVCSLYGGANFEYKDGIGCFFFDGTGDYIILNDFVVSDASNSYEFWMYANVQSTWGTIFDSGTERPLIGTYLSGFRVYPDGTVHATINTGKWYHIVVAFSSDDDYDVYVNGKSVADGIDYTSTQRTGTFDAWLGGDNGTETFNGWISVFRHYTHQLTSAQVLQNYNVEVTKFATVTNSLGMKISDGDTTFGGALTGTSATFTGNVTLSNGNLNVTGAGYIYCGTGATTNALELQNNSSVYTGNLLNLNLGGCDSADTGDFILCRNAHDNVFQVNAGGNATFGGSIITSTENQYGTLNGHYGGLQIKNSSSGSCGIYGSDSVNSFVWQLYGDSSGHYGFLGYEWGDWDLRKDVNAKLYLNDNYTYYLQPDSNSHFNTITTSGNATFGGNISLTSGKNITSGNMKIYIDDGSHSTSASYATFESLSDRGIDIRSQSQTRFYTDNANTLALTLDSSQNATFAGLLYSGNQVIKDTASTYSALIVEGNAGYDAKLLLKSDAGNANEDWWQIEARNADQRLWFRNGNTDLHYFESNGNVTFGGGVGVDGMIGSTTNMTGEQYLTRYVPSNIMAVGLNMVETAGSVGGAHTSDGIFNFNNTNNSWVGGFLSSSSYKRMNGRTLEWTIDATGTGDDGDQADHIMVGWSNGSALTDPNYAGLTYSFYFDKSISSDYNVYIYEHGTGRGVFISDVDFEDDILQLRIVLKMNSGADYYYRNSDERDGEWILVYESSYSSTTPLYPCLAPHSGRWLVHSMHVYDDDYAMYHTSGNTIIRGNATFVGSVTAPYLDIGRDGSNQSANFNGVVKIDVNTAGKNTFQFDTTGVDEGWFAIKNVDTVAIRLDADGDSYLNGGNVGIGTTVPLTALQVGIDNVGEPATFGSLIPKVIIMGATHNTSEDSLLRLIRPTYSAYLYPASVDFKVKCYGSLGSPWLSKTEFTIALKEGSGYNTGDTVDVMTLRSDLTATFSGDVWLNADSKKLKIGASGDFEVYHDGSSTRMNNATGHLIINNSSGAGNTEFEIQGSGSYTFDSSPATFAGSINANGGFERRLDQNSGTFMSLSNQNNGTSHYAEMYIQDSVGKLIMGYSNNYALGEWQGAWVYSNSGPLMLKSTTSDVEIFAGGTADSNRALILDTSLNATFAGVINASVNSTSLRLGATSAGSAGIYLNSTTGTHTGELMQIRNTAGNVFTINNNGTTSFGQNATFAGNIAGNSSNTTEVGTYSTGAIKRIRMSQGGEIHWGDTTTINFLGITEGVVDNFADQDTIGIYYRNELKMYSNSNTLRYTMDVNGNATFTADVDCKEMHVGTSPWGGTFGVRKEVSGDAVFSIENRDSGGYGGSFRAGNGGQYIVWMRSYDGTSRFKFYGNGTTAPSDISDERIKTNITDFDGNALENIKWLSSNLKTFQWKEDVNNDTTHLGWNTYTGFIAQTLMISEEDSLKRLVHTTQIEDDMTDNDRYYLDYKGITAQLVRAVADLEGQVADLKEQLN